MPGIYRIDAHVIVVSRVAVSRSLHIVAPEHDARFGSKAGM
jgi:hypothetical protein